MFCNGSLMSEDGFVRPCLVTITAKTNLGIFFVLAVITDDDDMIRSIR